MVSIAGVDYAWSHPGGAALKSAGKKFAARYLSHDASKNLSRREADDLAAHGISCVVVWESTAKRPLSGHAGGVADARAGLAQALQAGMPPGRPLYFAVDWDATPGQQAAINAYLDGAASVLGRDRVGIYGGYYPVQRALDAGKARWAWQTPAWSGGQWDRRAQIRQGRQVKIGGVTVDLDTAYAADFGQWMPGRSPVEDDMQMTDQVPLNEWIPKRWPEQAGLKDGKIAVSTALGSGYAYSKIAAEGTAALLAQVGALSAVIGKLAEGGGLDAAQAQAAAKAGAQEALGELAGDLAAALKED